MPAHTSMLHIRVDDETEAQATVVPGRHRPSVSEAVRLLLRRVVADDQAFLLKVPNAKTRQAVEESRAMMAATQARFKSPLRFGVPLVVGDPLRKLP